MDLLEFNSKELKKSDDQKDMFRNQGAIAILEKLIQIPNVIREHQKAKSLGEQKKVEVVK